MANDVSLKQPLSYEDQVKKLEEHNMIITDNEEALASMKAIGYYRFTGYALPYRIAEHDSEFVDGTDFDLILGYYHFDEALRNILRYYLEIVEVYHRVQIANGFSQIKCTIPPYDQHYNENNFYARDSYAEIFESFKDDIRKNYKDNPVIVHHLNNYNGKMPLWVIVEFLSFSNLSKLYNSMYDSDKEIIAKAVGTGRATLQNHLHCLSVLRNKCAHCARLYGKTLSPEGRFNRTFRENNKDVSVDSLFAYIVILMWRLPTRKLRMVLINDISNVVKKYNSTIDLAAIGFPNDYETRLRHYM